MIGTAVGNYVVRSKIGEGGMGAVYLAEHQRLGRRVAVKVLLPHLSGNPGLVARFFNEAKAATDIKNEHIVDVLDFGELPDGSSYIVMEWLDGQSLSELLRREGRVPVARTAHIARGIAEALAAAHAHGIVHRDLKPDNIFLVTRDGQPDFVKVLDFGIAKLMLADAGDVHTQTGALLGTPLYMSPEQCNGAPVDQRTDVYALGIILYQMLTGTLPFNAGKLTELLVAHATLKPAPLRAHDPSISVAIESAVLQALEKDPDHRFASVGALARAFSGDAPAAPTPPPSGTVAEVFVRLGVRGKRATLVLAAAGALVALLLLAVLLRRPVVVPVSPVMASTPTEISRWSLVSVSGCPRSSFPATVETTQTGAKITSRAPGYPDSVGTAEPDGGFRVRNKLGACSGRRIGDKVTETCGNRLGHCDASYARVE